MYVVCLVLSVLAAALGLFALGFGIQIRDFNLGNTMIITGAIAMVGSMVMFGIAAAVAQLRRIAEAARPRPSAPAIRRAGAPEAVDGPPQPAPGAPPQRQGPGARVPF